MMCLCLEKHKTTNRKALYCIGTGEGHGIIDVLRMAEKITDRKVDISYLEKRDFDVVRNVLDISKIRTVIGYYECLALEDGMRKYYDILRR